MSLELEADLCARLLVPDVYIRVVRAEEDATPAPTPAPAPAPAPAPTPAPVDCLATSTPTPLLPSPVVPPRTVLDPVGDHGDPVGMERVGDYDEPVLKSLSVHGSTTLGTLVQEGPPVVGDASGSLSTLPSCVFEGTSHHSDGLAADGTAGAAASHGSLEEVRLDDNIAGATLSVASIDQHEPRQSWNGNQVHDPVHLEPSPASDAVASDTLACAVGVSDAAVSDTLACAVGVSDEVAGDAVLWTGQGSAPQAVVKAGTPAAVEAEEAVEAAIEAEEVVEAAIEAEEVVETAVEATPVCRDMPPAAHEQSGIHTQPQVTHDPARAECVADSMQACPAVSHTAVLPEMELGPPVDPGSSGLPISPLLVAAPAAPAASSVDPAPCATGLPPAVSYSQGPGNVTEGSEEGVLVGEGAASRLGAPSQSVLSGDVARSLQEEPGEVVEQEIVGRPDATLYNECMDTGDEGACRVAAAQAQAQMEVQAPDASLDSADIMGELPRSHRALHCSIVTPHS